MIVIRTHKHSPQWPYDGGVALWDTETNTQVGWCISRKRAQEFANEEGNEETPQPSAGRNNAEGCTDTHRPEEPACEAAETGVEGSSCTAA